MYICKCMYIYIYIYLKSFLLRSEAGGGRRTAASALHPLSSTSSLPQAAPWPFKPLEPFRRKIGAPLEGGGAAGGLAMVRPAGGSRPDARATCSKSGMAFNAPPLWWAYRGTSLIRNVPCATCREGR